MTEVDATLLTALRARDLVSQTTADEALADHLAEPRTVYCGFDPSAESLHIGSLVPLLALRRFQEAGHRPVALVGGATGLIGDPSFKVAERQLNSAEVVAAWAESLRDQIGQFIDFDAGAASAVLVNNLDWMRDMPALTFLRDVGKHFSVNAMIQKESVRQRLERDGSGISYTEFTYMLLQAYDFAELYKRYDCTVQVGGSDQWGNITAGIDLTRRLHQAQTYGLTLPLITRADGSKFGKTESGTIWLDAARTSPYAFYQFWLNTADADVYRFLKYFTFLPPAEIDALAAADAERQGRPEAQSVLANAVTVLVHGHEGVAAAKRISEALFSGDLTSLSEADCRQLRLDGLPTSELDPAALGDQPLTSLLSEAGLAGSGKQVKDALARESVFINGVPVAAERNMDTATLFNRQQALWGRFFIVRLGKKKHHLFVLPEA